MGCKLRVLFITHYSSFFGANLSMINLIRDLRERYAIEPYVLYSGEGKDLPEVLEKENINAVHIEYKNTWCGGIYSKNRFKRLIKKMIFPVRMAIDEIYNRTICYHDIEKIVKTIAPDIIHTNSSVSCIGYYLSQRFHIPHVWHVREFGDLDYNLHFVRGKNATDKIFSSANYIIAISDAMRRHYEKIAPNARITRIYNGVRPFTLDKSRADKVTFCCVGLISAKKNQMAILKAASLIRDKIAGQFRILFVGSGDEVYIQKLKTFIAENQLEDIVEFTGYQSDIKPYLQVSDVGIMPSESEAFGRVTVEYMLAEMPVIGTNSGGTPEIIVPNETGFLYEPADYVKLGNYMKYFILNRDKVKKFGESGRKRALDKFNVCSNTDNVFELYQKVLAEQNC